MCLAAIDTLSYALLATQANKLLSSIAAKRRLATAGGIAISAAGLWALTTEQTR